MLCKCINNYCIYIVHLSPALSRNSEISCFQCSEAVEKRDKIMVVFYLGLPHTCTHIYSQVFEYLYKQNNKFQGHKMVIQ